MNRWWLVWVAVIFFALLSREASAEDRRCDGPAECCPTRLADHLPHTTTVQIGVVFMGLENLNERAGTWDADFYLYERWPVTPDFTPQTEVVNEVERHATLFDTTELRDGTCQRSRRIHSTLRCNYNLRTFPFDRQGLPLVISDDEFVVGDVTYADRASPVGFDDGVRDLVAGWSVEGEPSFVHGARSFAWEVGAPKYDYATFRVPVRRHVTFHVTKYFVPLLVIVAIAFTVFWIESEDLSSQVTIGVTCVLAAIAFQLAEAGNLPAVAYLTLADRVYAACYLAIGLAVVETVYTNGLARAGQKELAVRVDRACRIAFPAVLAIALIASTVRAFS